MPANKFTLKAVDAILEADLGVTAVIRRNVQKMLGEEAPTSCGETEAARILDVSTATLYHWRKGEWQKAPHAFLFRVWFNPCGEVRYDIEQLQAYASLRRARSSHQTPQPEITADEVAQFQECLAGRV